MKNLFSWTVLLVCLIFSGCKSHEIITKINKESRPPDKVYNIQILKTLYIDKNFSFEEKKAIKTAKDNWEYSTNGIIKYNLIFDYDVDLAETIPSKIIIAKPDKNTLIKLDSVVESGKFLSGTLKTEKFELILIIPSRMDFNELTARLMKELGNELDLYEIDSSVPAIMSGNEKLNTYCITEYDMVGFCMKYFCKVQDTKFCESKPIIKNTVNSVNDNILL